MRPGESAFFQPFAKEAQPGAVKPDGLEQAVPFVDEKVESTPGHGLLHELSNDPLKAEHAIAHVDGFFEQVSNGVLRQCKHRPLFSHACLQWFWLSAYPHQGGEIVACLQLTMLHLWLMREAGGTHLTDARSFPRSPLVSIHALSLSKIGLVESHFHPSFEISQPSVYLQFYF